MRKARCVCAEASIGSRKGWIRRCGFRGGCPVVLKDGSEIYPDSIPEERWEQIECIGEVVDGIGITRAKELLRKYGGSAWTEHYERDGTLFEVTEIHLAGNNSRFKYNHHL